MKEEPNKTNKRFKFHELELADWNSYSVMDMQERKIVCHLLPENGIEYCKDLGNKIANLLNESIQTL